MKKTAIIFSILVGGSASTSALATNMSFTGNLVIPNCTVTVNGGNPIAFGNIEIQNVDNQKGARQVTAALSCPYHVGTPYIKITGNALTGTESEENVLTTDKDWLGIALYQGSAVEPTKKLKLGNGLAGNGYAITDGLANGTNTEQTFTFTSVPYSSDYTKLTPGNFSASATMEVIYN